MARNARPLGAAIIVVTMAAAVGACTGPADRPAGTGGGVPPGSPWRRLVAAPTERTEVAATVAGTLVYVIGGYLADGSTVSTVDVLDTVTGSWSSGPDLPLAVNHAMAVTVAGRPHVFGGYRADNAASTAAFRLDGSAWTPVTGLPEGRAAGTAALVGDRVYVAGGVGAGGGLAERMLVYHPATDRWSSVDGPPTRREHLGGAAWGGKLYTVGGRVQGALLGAFEVYDPDTGRWSGLPDLPTPRGGLGATAACPGQVVAAGGEATATFAEVEAFDLGTGAWRTLAPLPTARHGLGVVAVGPTLYTLSGGPRPGLHVSAATEVLDLGPCPS